MKNSIFFNTIYSDYFNLNENKKLHTNKEAIANVVLKSGFSIAKKIAIFRDLNEIDLSLIKNSAVLKYGCGWSSLGVMILQKFRENIYFNHMNKKCYSYEDILLFQKQVAEKFSAKEDYWILEEFIESSNDVGIIPFDYKFYVINGLLKLVIQIDRNVFPPKIAVFDSSFCPMKHGKDYEIKNAKDFSVGVPVIPLNAYEMVGMAQELSRLPKEKFVSVDLYDAPCGPYFGEFTFSPGLIAKENVIFSEDVVKDLDRSFVGDFFNGVRESQGVNIPPPLYSALARNAYRGVVGSAKALANLYWRLEENSGADSLSKKSARFMKKSWNNVSEYIEEI